MNKFVSYEKLSKKAKRAEAQKRRRDWGALSPITRKAPNPRAYQRQKTRSQNLWTDSETGSFIYRGDLGHEFVGFLFFIFRGGAMLIFGKEVVK